MVNKKIFRKNVAEDFSNVIVSDSKTFYIDKSHNLSLKNIVTRYHA